MKFADYRQHDATALADLVARREVSAPELLDVALARLAEVQPALNPVCRPMEAEARAQLAAPRPLRGPFAGVPFLVKDASQDVAGLPTSYGSRSMIGTVPREHAAVVRRCLEAGFVIFGKTNTPEFALKGVTDPELFGRTSNPWNPAHTPGGSSGGAAAAVASGVVPMAAGNDGGGSIRIPAACCGLFGLRPSRGRVSQGPAIGEVWYGASSEGVLSRSVRDTARVLDLLQGAEPGDPFVIAPPAEPYLKAMQREPGRLRIGFSTASPIGTPVHAEAVAAVQDAVRLLQSLGHEVEEASPEVDGEALARSFLVLYFGQVASAMARARKTGAKDADFELLSRVIETLGGTIDAGAATTELLAWNAYARGLARFHARFDLLLTPTLATPPIRHEDGELARGEQRLLAVLDRTGLLRVLARLGALDATVDRLAKENLEYYPFTQLSNLTGTPSMSVPLHWTAAGLPLGVQFVAPFGREDRLLQLARQLEQVRPWFGRVPA
jgi:amidase